MNLPLNGYCTQHFCAAYKLVYWWDVPPFYQRYQSSQLEMCRAALALMVSFGAFVGEVHVRVQSAGLHKLHTDAAGLAQENK